MPATASYRTLDLDHPEHVLGWALVGQLGPQGAADHALNEFVRQGYEVVATAGTHVVLRSTTPAA